MRKRYLMSMMVIGVTMTMVGLGTFAYWSSSQTISGNTISTGSFTIYEEIHNVAGTLPNPSNFGVGNLVPSVSYTKSGYIFIGNAASSGAPAQVTLSFSGLSFPPESAASGCSSGCSGASCINVQLVMNPAEYNYSSTNNHGLSVNNTPAMGNAISLAKPTGETGLTLGDWITSPTNVYVMPSGVDILPGQYIILGVQAELQSCVTDPWFMSQSTPSFSAIVTAIQQG